MNEWPKFNARSPLANLISTGAVPALCKCCAVPALASRQAMESSQSSNQHNHCSHRSLKQLSVIQASQPSQTTRAGLSVARPVPSHAHHILVGRHKSSLIHIGSHSLAFYGTHSQSLHRLSAISRTSGHIAIAAMNSKSGDSTQFNAIQCHSIKLSQTQIY